MFPESYTRCFIQSSEIVHFNTLNCIMFRKCLENAEILFGDKRVRRCSKTNKILHLNYCIIIVIWNRSDLTIINSKLHEESVLEYCIFLVEFLYNIFSSLLTSFEICDLGTVGENSVYILSAIGLKQFCSAVH